MPGFLGLSCPLPAVHLQLAELSPQFGNPAQLICHRATLRMRTVEQSNQHNSGLHLQQILQKSSPQCLHWLAPTNHLLLPKQHFPSGYFHVSVPLSAHF